MSDAMLKSIKQIFIEDNEISFNIPFYQRNFSWGKDEIHQLIYDIYESYNQDNSKKYFIGTLVTIKNNNFFEVIDGQQRLTVLSLLLRYLDVENLKLCLSYDARPHVLKFLEQFYQDLTVNDEPPKEFCNAILFIKQWRSNINNYNIDNLKTDHQFKEYLLDKVFIVHNTMPEDTDVEAYFEIMNNRGAQLQSHEILKARFLDKIDNNMRENASLIWDICSQMDIPIQKQLPIATAQKLFNENIDGIINENDFEKFLCGIIVDKNEYAIQDILDHDRNFIRCNADPIDDNSNINSIDEHSSAKSIIDFPNFLMHIFKLLDTNISLNDKNLLDENIDNLIDNNPVKVLYKIFYSRVFFDRFIVRFDDRIDNPWSLQKPKYYVKTSNLSFVNTFGKQDKHVDEYNDQEESIEHDQVVKALSMLQVSVSTRVYKKWLFDILKKYCCEANQGFDNITNAEYLKLLHEIMEEMYKNIREAREDNFLKQGTDTHHTLFFFIDYLYYVVKLKNLMEFGELSHIKNFSNFHFKYSNSIEHFLSKHYSRDTNIESNLIDYIGNLFITSTSTNSRLSDRSPLEKSQRISNINAPKQEIMYSIVKVQGKWEEEHINEHYKNIVKLLGSYKKILGIAD